ncbi:MAG: NF038122 family metalloprotease [Chamaesiphon sp.]|nr:NF038122 family metalloprotease [Chamaesiphon sp.]
MTTYIAKINQFAVMTGMALSGIGSSAVTPANALTFNFTSTDVALQQAIDGSAAPGSSQALAANGFKAAGSRWSSLFTNNVTVNISIEFKPLATNILGLANSSTQNFSYAQVYNALSNHQSSDDDRNAVTHLSSSPALSRLINYTANNPNVADISTPYVYSADPNSLIMELTNANAKALGLATTGVTDAFISFSSDFSFDFNPTDDISADTIDFVGLATHEIGHSLGFFSGVDILDSNISPINSNGPFNDSLFEFVTPLDLFRYSTQSTALGTIDWTADRRDKYFSLDGGANSIASFATGVNFGDKQQASHWKDELGIGIMDPTFAFGQLGEISQTDIRAFDVIGWNRADAAVAVPEPANFIGTFIFAAFGAQLVLKRRKKLFKSVKKAA